MYVFSLLVLVGFLGCIVSYHLGQALRFLEEPSSIVALRNSEVSLNCTATAGPTVSSRTTIFWRKDGALVRSNSNFQVLSSGHLVIRHFRGRKDVQSDEGVYQCFASNKEGTIASRKARLRLAVLSRAFKEWPKNVTVLLGETARFACQSKHALPEPTVVWRKDGQTVSPGGRHVVLPNGVLQILKVQKSDDGKYQCIIRNIAKRRTSVAGWLQVKQVIQPVRNPLHFAVIPGNTSAISGHRVIMECIATGLPVPFVQWKKVGKFDKQGLAATSAHEGSSNLQISSVSVRDQGEYLCVISGGGKTIMQSAYLFVKEPPQFLAKPPANDIALMGKTVKLTCSVRGSPMPRITWLKDGQVVTLGSRIIMNNKGVNRELKIMGVSQKDEGVYQCFAENSLGSTQSSTRVIVKRSAINMSPPRDLVAIPLSDSKIRITWKAPIAHPNVIAYEVAYYTPDNSSKQYVSRKTSYTLHGLQGFTYYFISISPFYNQHGVGAKSKIVKIRTFEGKPTSPPTNVLLTSNTPDSIDVHWIPPLKRYCNGIITNYLIRYSPRDRSSPVKIMQVSSAVSQRTVSGLIKGKSYRFQLAAATSKGIGPFSNEEFHTVTTKFHNVISAPNMSVNIINSTTLVVTWQKPSYGADKIQQYRLSYIKDSTPFESFGPLNISKDSNEFSITGLSHDTNYIIRLMAWDGTKPGKPSLESAQTSIGALPVPGKRSSVGAKCQSTGPNTLWISWQKVFSPRRIAYYKLRYEVKGNLNHETVRTKAVRNGFDTYLDSLIPGKKYEITVKPIGSDGKEIAKFFGSTVDCDTPESAPSSPPRNIQFKIKSKTTLDLNWEPPLTPNGKITSYLIAYSTDKDLPDDQWNTKTDTVLANFFKRFEKFINFSLQDLKYNTAYYIKVKAGNKQGYGPFSKPIKVFMVSSKDGDSKNMLKVSFTFVSTSVIEIKWTYPVTSNGKPKQYRVIYTMNPTLPHSKWYSVPVVVNQWPQKPDRSVSVQLANLSANQTYYVKVQADYGSLNGPWSEQIKIQMRDNPLAQGITKNETTTDTGATSSDARSSKNEKEDFEVKLGIIIGCVISAFCIVVLVLFIIWRCPCRFTHGRNHATEAKKNGLPNGLPNGNPNGMANGIPNGLPNGYSVSTSHQSMVSARQGQNYEESSGGSSVGSGLCQCRCTCSAGRWPPLSSMQSKPHNHKGNGHIITGNGHLVTPSQTSPKSKSFSVKGEKEKVMNGYSLQEPPVPLQMLAVQENGKVVVNTKAANTKSISVDV